MARFFVKGVHMRVYDKPFKTYDELLEHLQNNLNLTIGNQNIALLSLKTFSYYNLVNGYKECFLENGKFLQHLRLEDLIQFSIFDRNFQNILFKYSVYVENVFKTKLAYAISKHFGVDQRNYLNKEHYISLKYRNTRKRKTILIDVLNEIRDSLNTDLNPTHFYVKRHNHVPPWILFRNIKFSLCVNLYSFLPSVVKQEIIGDYFHSVLVSKEEKAELLKNMLTIVREFRNVIAHHSKFVTFHSKIHLYQNNLVKILPQGVISNKDRRLKIGRNDIYSYILCLVSLLNTPLLTMPMIREIRSIISDNKNISKLYAELTKLPPDFSNKLKILYSTQDKMLRTLQMSEFETVN